MEIKINYFLIGKETTFVETEERDEDYPFFLKRITKAYFLYCINQICEEGSFEGTGTECLVFDEKVGKFEDLELGKYYMLVTDGNVALFFKDITEEKHLFENNMLLDVEYPKVDKTILEKIMS